MKAIYLNHYLSDTDVANIARQSFAKRAEEYTEEQNHNLIKYLARGMASKDWDKLMWELLSIGSKDDAEALAVHLRNIPEHWVPFGHPQITLRMQAPIPIARQAFKHKVGLCESEESRRYISTKPEYFIPEYFRAKAANVKQGSAGEHPDNKYWLDMYKRQCEVAIQYYEDMIAAGICPEQARFILPQGCEVNWVWTGSLYAFANYYNQRSDGHAQQESQDLAEAVNQIIAPLYPVSWNALTQGDY